MTVLVYQLALHGVYLELLPYYILLYLVSLIMVKGLKIILLPANGLELTWLEILRIKLLVATNS
jgi:hypothetical protein